jgi:ankyrin repeat protein
LNALPSTLDENYKEAIQRIERSPTKSLAFRVLTWIVYAVRPLQLEEVLHAIAIDELEPEDEAVTKDCLTPPSTIVNACVGMIRIDKESNVVGLVHKTTQEYFDKNGSNYFPYAHRDITASCLRYLSLHTFSSGPCISEELLRRRLRENALLDYAVLSFGDHISRGFDHSLKNMALRVFLDTQTMSSAGQVLYDARNWSVINSPFHKNFQGVHFAAYFGLTDILKLLVETGNVDVDLKDSGGRTPLSWAAENGHEAVARLLLEYKAEIDMQDEDGGTPLWWASRGGHEATVKLLLEYKAKINIKDEYGRTPLLWAAYEDEAVVKLLLENKAEINTQDEDGRTPLSLAAENGHEAVVKLLVETGNIDVDSKDSEGWTPLFWAAAKGHEAVVKLLVETGNIDVDSKDRWDQTPLSLASENGHEAVVKLLVETGNIDVDSKDR